METKKSKVKATTLKREGTGQYGQYYIHTIIFENGDNGDYTAKSNPQTYFKEGHEAEYTKEVKQNGQYQNTIIKPIQQNKGEFNGGNAVLQNRRIALQSSVVLVASEIIPPDELYTYSNNFVSWLNDESKTSQQKSKPQEAILLTENPGNNSNDDLPF